MAEPVSSTAGAVGAKFALSSGLGAGMAAIIVMALAYPKTKREFLAAMVATLATSVFGGAALIEHFGLQAWGTPAQGLWYFVAGLPAWIAVRALFVWSESDKGRSLVDLITEIKSAMRD